MAQDTIVQCKGLVTQYNPLNVAPGVLIKANDCIIRRENTIENRRGYLSYGSLSNVGNQCLVYLKRILAHNGTSLSYDNGSGTFTDYSTSVTAPTSEKVRGVEAFQNLYFTSNVGVGVATALSSSSIRKSGVPRALNVTLSTTGATGFLSNLKNVAYRSVIQRSDANSNTIFGYPSSRSRVYNSSGGSRNVLVTAYLPSEVTTSDIIQIYRTEQVAAASSTDDTAGDEMALVYQVNPTSTDITNGYISFTDSITDELRGASLYTSPSQETISQANDRPPLCKDIALYKSDYLFFANTSTKQRLNLTLVGTASLTGQTIKIAGVTYNFGATEIISGGGSPQVLVSATGVAAVDIDLTARSFVKVINLYASNTSVYAYYLSGSDDLPGQILIEERGVGASAFTVQSSNTAIAGMFFPQPPVSPSTSISSTSSNEVRKNGIYFSKGQQPEHVPVTNYIFAGPANAEILRIVALRDSLIIISEAGVYRLTGESPQNFQVNPLDLTVFCKCKDSVAVLANQVFMLSNQGIVSVSDTGVQVVSREIEPEIIPLLTYSNISNYTSGVAYESDRCYLLSTISNSTDTEANQTFVFNAFTRTWTRYTFGFNSGIVEPSTDKLFFTKSSQSLVYKERKDFSDSDYADPESSITITVLSPKLRFTSSVVPLEGWIVYQGSTGIPITSVTSLGSSLYEANLLYSVPTSWTTGAATIFPSVSMEIEWAPWTGAQPGIMKHVRQVSFLTDSLANNNTASLLKGTFRTDIDSTIEEINIENSSARWGLKLWGLFPWGGNSDTFAYPTYVPMNKQYSRSLVVGSKHNRGMEKVSISGVTFTFEMISERISK